MPVERERIPDGVPEDFQALDGDEIVGQVYQIPTGLERGLWFWTMTALRPGPRITFLTNGTEARRSQPPNWILTEPSAFFFEVTLLSV
jgi:hypothetical protein